MPADHPTDRPPWRITDTACDQLAGCLIGHDCERGAALLGPPNQRLITHVLPDPEPGTAVSYRHSDALRRLLEATLEGHPTLGYRGTAHTHPGAWAEPSAQDRMASRAVLDANPALGHDVLFPVVVDLPIAALDVVATAWGDDHLLTIDGGTLACYVLAERGRVDGDHHVAVTISVLGARAFVERLCANTDRLSRPGGTVREASTAVVWLRYLLTSPRTAGDPGPSDHAQVLVHPDFPTAAPMFSVGDAPFWTPPWDPSLSEPDRQARAARALEESL